MNKEAMPLEGLTGKRTVQALTHLLSFIGHAPLDEEVSHTIVAVPKMTTASTAPIPKNLQDARDNFLHSVQSNRFINNMPGAPS